MSSQALFRDRSKGLPKRDRTRLALIDSTVEVIAQKGMDLAKISDITEHAGLANGTFYNHFADKDEILTEAAQRIAVEMAREIDNEMRTVDSAVARMVTATTRAIRMAVSESAWGAVIIGALQHLPSVRGDILQFLKADLQRGIDQDLFDIELDEFFLDQIASLLAASIRTQIDTGPDPVKTARTCENILRLCGFTRAKAQKAVAAHTPE
ncbi:MAG: TetR/AcrR family transcriptional regulator [Parvibaculaceae bacterium]|nr:TetR/AcrR family transcriptional regulator [Parvibaculaceae bacterium]HBM87552.1 TetR/AcrR family transcriptional regulator [Rhodobiaceae bacterium]